MFKFLSLLLMSTTLLQAAISLPVEINNWLPISRSGEPVSAGFPLPEGAVYDISKLRITDQAGNTVPAQFKWLSKWWHEKENGFAAEPSLKWVLCDFQSEQINASGKLSYIIKDDNSSNSTTYALSIVDGAAQVTVVTGPLKFTVSKSSFNLFDELWLDKNGNKTFEVTEKIISSSAANGGTIVAGDWAAGGCTTGVAHTTGIRAPERVVIEESGPVKVTLRIEGRHYAAAKGLARGLYGYQVFITAYAGKSFVDVQYALTNTYMEGSKPEVTVNPYTMFSWPFTSYKLNIGFSMSTTQSYVLLGDNEVSGVLDNTKRLYQYSGGYSLTGTSGGTNAKGGALITDGAVGVAVVMRDFAPNNPKALTVSNNLLSIELFPDTGSSTYSLDPYSRKNHRMRFQFFDNAPVSGNLLDLWKINDAPLRMLASREWYQSTRAWDRGFGIPPHSGWNRLSPSAWTRMTKVSSDTGWKGYAAIGEFNGGGDHWNLTSCFWSYLLRGNPGDFEYSESRALYFNDLVTVQTSSTRFSDLNHYVNVEANVTGYSGHAPEFAYNSVLSAFPAFKWNRSNRPDDGHMPNMQVYEYYLLTGDLPTYDAIMSQAVRAMGSIYYRTYSIYSDYNYRSGRGVAHLDSIYGWGSGPRYMARPSIVAGQGYEVSGDPRILRCLKLGSYPLRNNQRRSPIAYMANVNSTYVGGAATVWETNHPGVTAPPAFSGSDFQIGIGMEALFNNWIATRDEEIRDALIFGAMGLEWRAGIDSTGKYLGFTYSGWADPLCDGKRYSDVGLGGSFTSSASEGFAGMIFGYLVSGRKDLWKVIADGLTKYVNFYPGGNQIEMKLINMWQAKWKHDSLDTIPPAAIKDLSVEKISGQGIRLTFTAPGSDTTTGRAREYQIKYSRAPIVDFVRRWDPVAKTGWPNLNDPIPTTDSALYGKCKLYTSNEEISFWAAHNVKNEPVPQNGGSRESILLTGIPDSEAVYFAVVTFDENNNASAISNIASTVQAEQATSSLPVKFGFSGITPNPFNPTTNFYFSVDNSGNKVVVEIYTVSGKKVAKLLDSSIRTGHGKVTWNGCDENGKPLSSGIFTVKIKQGNRIAVKKVVLSR